MKKAIVLLALAVFISGCASTSINLYQNKSSYGPTDPKGVKVFHKMPQDRAFIELGEVTVSRVTMWEWAENELKKKAAELGGDAVYIINMGDTTQGAMANGYGGIGSTLIVTGVVIKYKDTAK